MSVELAALMALGVVVVKQLEQKGSGTRVDVSSLRRLVEQINDEYGGWFDVDQVLAIIEVESKGDIYAYRYEPRLKDASYGLMQILFRVAQDRGYQGEPDGLYDPATNLRYGMAHLYWSWYALENRLGRSPTITEWIGSYNAGVAGVARNGPPAQYVIKWTNALEEVRAG